jgi:hypothetical protein
MSALVIIVSFIANTADAAYCTKPMAMEDAQAALTTQIVPNGDFPAWKQKHPGFTPPNIIIRGSPGYNDALNGKIVDDPLLGVSRNVAPCAPFPAD